MRDRILELEAKTTPGGNKGAVAGGVEVAVQGGAGPVARRRGSGAAPRRKQGGSAGRSRTSSERSGGSAGDRAPRDATGAGGGPEGIDDVAWGQADDAGFEDEDEDEKDAGEGGRSRDRTALLREHQVSMQSIPGLPGLMVAEEDSDE